MTLKTIEFTWNKAFNPSLIINRLNQARIQKDGKVTYRNLGFEEVGAILFSCLESKNKIQYDTKRQIIRNALFHPSDKQKLSPNELLSLVNKVTKLYFKSKPKDYYLVTSLSYFGSFPINWTSANKCRAYFKFKSDIFYKNKKSSRSDLSENFKKLQIPAQRRNYPYAVVRVSARSDTEAFQDAIEALDQIRGLINLYLNLRSGLRISFGSRQPVNKLRLGPLHSLHNMDGSLATEMFWYEPDFIESDTLENLGNKKEALQKFIQHTKRRLIYSNLSEEAIEGLLHYTRALDHRDWRVAFQQLWMTLEFLTGTRDARYDLTIRRAAKIYQDYEVALEVLKHLRFRRNELIHSNAEDPEIETLMYQIKGIVERLLIIYVNNSFKFKNKDEVAQFLDLPRDSAKLRRRRQLIDAALTFQR